MPTIRMKGGDGATIVLDLRCDSNGRFVAEVDGRQVEGQFEELRGGEFILRIGPRIVPCYGWRKDSGIEVWVDGERHVFDIAKPRSRSGHAETSQVAEEILAPMPGTVLRIHVQAGDRFTAHQPLMILESMKMEMTLSAPHAGRVREIRCTVGELVAMGSVLAKLEGLESDAKIASSSEGR